jgi:hypothetical protein
MVLKAGIPLVQLHIIQKIIPVLARPIAVDDPP